MLLTRAGAVPTVLPLPTPKLHIFPAPFSITSDDALESIIMTQYNMRKGLEMFGDAGIEAVVKELEQLHIMDVLQPISRNNLSYEQHRAALQ